MKNNTPGPLERLALLPARDRKNYCEMCGKRDTSARLEPGFTPDGQAKTLCAQCRLGSAEILSDQRAALLDAIKRMTANLIEAHMEEFEDCHGGDVNHTGEAPEDCSYCKDIAKSRELLKAAGRDVAALTPEVEP